MAESLAGSDTAATNVTGRTPRWSLVIWGVILLALMVGVRYWVNHVGALPGDRWAARHLIYHSEQSVVLIQLETFFSTLATGTIAGATVTAAVIILARRCGPLSSLGLLFSALAVAWNALLKHLWGPTRLFHHVFVSAPFPVAGGDNYPSGHVTYAVAIFGYLAVVARRRGVTEIAVIGALFVIGMGPARVLAGDHLVSDAVGGYLLGGGWLLVVLGLEPVWTQRAPLRARRQPGLRS